MRWIGASVLASAGLVLVLAEPPAEACSCSGTPIVSPDGATAVPLNGVVYSYERNWTYERSIELIDPNGETIQLGERSSETTSNGSLFRILEPADSLSALTTYEVGQQDYVTNRVFTTGATIDEEAPLAPTIDSLQLETIRIEGTGYNSGGCFEEQMGWHGRVIPHLAALEADTQIVLVELMGSPDGPRLDILPMFGRDGAFYGVLQDSTCSQRPTFPLTPGLELCARGIAYDAAGNASEPGEVVCGNYIECGIESLDDFWDKDRCTPPLPDVDDGRVDEGKASGSSGCSTSSRGGQGAWMLLLALYAMARQRESRMAAGGIPSERLESRNRAKLALVTASLLLVITCLGCQGGASGDAGVATPDACTAEYIPAIRGTVTGQDGAPLLPSDIEACANERCAPCRVEVASSEITYDCSGIEPDRTVEEVPAVLHVLSASVGGSSWSFDVNVGRRDNCHWITTELDLVLPPPNGRGG